MNEPQPFEELAARYRQDGYEEECEPLRQALIIRNVIVHGGRPDDLPPELTPTVLAVARRLLGPDRHDSHLQVYTQAKTSASRSAAGRSDLEQITAGAQAVLAGILSHWRSDVLAQWNWAGAGRGHPVVLLRLSDVTAAVFAVFEPAELSDLARLEDRLGWLWAELLEIRSHRQMDRILRLSATPEATVPVRTDA